MHLNETDLVTLAELSVRAAQEAGSVIKSFTAGEVSVQKKEGGDSVASQVVTEVDERAQEAILDVLASSIEEYDLALLTEELADDGSRFEKDYFWCIDPLDGTLPFTQGKPGYAVAIALVRRDGEPMVGVAYDPVESRLYRAVAGQGLTLNGETWKRPHRDEGDSTSLHFYVDCTFETDPRREVMEQQIKLLAQKMGFTESLIKIGGGAVCNACKVLEDSPSLYIKPPKPELGSGSFWDFAATACIFQEAGGAVSDYGGQRLELNSDTHSFFNHCGVRFCSSPELAERVQACL